jgi:PPE-repeat protein
MTSNVGSADRAIRFVLGVALIALGLMHVFTGGLAIAAYAVGAIALLTGTIGFCPAWSVFGISTCPLKAKESK